VAKKPAIQARQGHPTGIIDDIGKAIGSAVRKTENKVYRKTEDVLLNRQARKQVTRKMAPFKEDRAFYRSEKKEEIRREGGAFFYNAPKKNKKLVKVIKKSMKDSMKNPKPPSQWSKMNGGK
jgi:hypothetical protein